MAAANPFKRKFQTLEAALKEAQKQPLIGVTQGGSSSKNSGARPAAKDADVQNPPR